MTATENDVSDTCVAKSDQLNADDLISGPIVVSVTGVKRSSDEQPIAIQISGGHQPFKPCKTVRRILVFAWGKDAKQWTGKSMKLVRDPDVKWAGVAVGGIRIAALSHITEKFSMSLAESRKSKKTFQIEKLDTGANSQSTPSIMSAFTSMKDEWKRSRETSRLPVGKEDFANFVVAATGGKVAIDKVMSVSSYSAALIALCYAKLQEHSPPAPPSANDDVAGWRNMIDKLTTEFDLMSLYKDFEAVRSTKPDATIEAIEALFSARLETINKEPAL